MGQKAWSLLTDPNPQHHTALLQECCGKTYTASCHLCKLFHQSPGCSATRWTAELHKLKESEGKEQLWQSLPRTVKVVKAGNGAAVRSHYRWWLDICREFCRCLRSWDKEAKALKGDLCELFYCTKLGDRRQQVVSSFMAVVSPFAGADTTR